MNSMLSLEEVKRYLDIEQKELEKYLKQGKLQAYRIGGTYLRFRKEDVLNLRFEAKPKKAPRPKTGFFAKVGDFWRFNNFYIISLVIVASLVYLFVRTSTS